MKSNISEIARNIENNRIDKGDKENPFRVSDILRATITVDQPQQLEDAYEAINK